MAIFVPQGDANSKFPQIWKFQNLAQFLICELQNYPSTICIQQHGASAQSIIGFLGGLQKHHHPPHPQNLYPSVEGLRHDLSKLSCFHFYFDFDFFIQRSQNELSLVKNEKASFQEQRFLPKTQTVQEQKTSTSQPFIFA